MIARLFRCVALVAVVGIGAAMLTSCSSTTEDAATVTYTDESGDHTVHISPEEVLDFVHELTRHEGLRERYAQSFVHGDNKNTTDASFTSAYLTQLINQVGYDAEFRARNTQLAPDATKNAQDYWKSRLAVQEEAAGVTSIEQLKSKAYDELPESLRNDLVESQARTDAVRSACPSNRLLTDLVFDTREHARAVFDRVVAAGDLDTVIQQLQQEQDSGVVGATRSCFFPGTGDPSDAYQQAALTAPLGQLSVPLGTEQGFHLLYPEQWDPSVLSQNQQLAQSVADYNDKQVGDRISKMRVYVNPRFGTWDPTTGQVLQPAVPNPAASREGNRLVTTTTVAFDPTQPGG